MGDLLSARDEGLDTLQLAGRAVLVELVLALELGGLAGGLHVLLESVPLDCQMASRPSGRGRSSARDGWTTYPGKFWD